jgi:hypothetical protein
MGHFWTEQRQRQSKRRRRKWPKWLRSQLLIRLLFTLAPMIYRIVRLLRDLTGLDDG